MLASYLYTSQTIPRTLRRFKASLTPNFNFAHMEQLIKQPHTIYQPPISPLPSSFTAQQRQKLSQVSSIPFGTATKEQLFFVDPTWTFLNHGAFGGALRLGFEEAEQWRRYVELQPLRFFDRDLLPHLADSVRMLSEFINAKPTDLVLLPNATSGLNVVLRSVISNLNASQDRVVMYDTAYGSVKKIIIDQCNKYNIQLDVISFPLPLSCNEKEAKEQLLSSLTDVIDANTKLVILDHTTSQTAINLPILEMTQKCKELGCERVVVDGAHGLLAKELDMELLKKGGVDYYISNCHKWMSSPKSIGMLWVTSDQYKQECLENVNVISHGYDKGFSSGLLWDGCKDYSSVLALPSVLQFWKNVGIDTVHNYTNDLLNKAIVLLRDEWSENEGGCLIGPQELVGPMALVSLPSSTFDLQNGNATSNDAEEIQDLLYEKEIECPVKNIQGVLYVRISVHVYNELKDYEVLAKGVLEIMSERERNGSV